MSEEQPEALPAEKRNKRASDRVAVTYEAGSDLEEDALEQTANPSYTVQSPSAPSL